MYWAKEYFGINEIKKSKLEAWSLFNGGKEEAQRNKRIYT
jgi:hypothetical protein